LRKSESWNVIEDEKIFNLQVKSIDVPYEIMYFNRIILVMQALEVDISQIFIAGAHGGTHKEPRANMNPKANFFFKSRFRALSSITGKNIMIKSSSMLTPAAE
jgi:hypothetical protein